MRQVLPCKRFVYWHSLRHNSRRKMNETKIMVTPSFDFQYYKTYKMVDKSTLGNTLSHYFTGNAKIDAGNTDNCSMI